jgi:hypothetical protein
LPVRLRTIIDLVAAALGPKEGGALGHLRRWRPGQGRPAGAKGRRLVIGRVFGVVLEGWLEPEGGREPGSRRRWRRWPEGVAGGHHVANHYAFLLDAVVMSVRTAAPRHGLDRDRGHALFAAFCQHFWQAFAPQVPPGFAYLALDVGHHQGRSHLFVAAIRETADSREDSRLIAILPYSNLVERAVAQASLARLPGRERIVGVAIDLADELATLSAAAWPWAVIVADLRHVVRQILLPLASARQAGIALLPRRMSAATASGQKRDGVKALLERRHHRLGPAERDRRDLALAILGPETRTIYLLKERILDLYRICDPALAAERLDEIFAGLAAFDPAAARLENAITTIAVIWQDRVLNHFLHEITTAYVESAIGRFKTRFDAWSVSGAFDQHYVRTLAHEGGLDSEFVEAVAWRTAEDFLTTKESTA